MGFIPPNNNFNGGNNRGHSGRPVTGTPTGRGSMPTGDRFSVKETDPPAEFPAAPVTPGKGLIPINPWDSTGRPNRATAIPDDSDLRIPNGR